MRSMISLHGKNCCLVFVLDVLLDSYTGCLLLAVCDMVSEILFHLVHGFYDFIDSFISLFLACYSKLNISTSCSL